MQFKIPQDVQMEDKIVGPLTLKQLIIVGVGGGIDYFLYISLSKVYILTVWVIPVLVIGLFTLAVAFLKIRGVPFIQYMLLSFEFYFKARQRVWVQGAGEVFMSITSPQPKTKDELKQLKQLEKGPKDLSSIEEITKSFDSYNEMLEEKSSQS